MGTRRKETPTQQELYCQWFTPTSVSEKFLEWCRIAPTDVLLEPAAGEGALIPEYHSQVLAFEIDPDRCTELRNNRPLATVICSDFLCLPPPSSPIADVAVQNPPFTNNGEGMFIDRALSWAQRTCALVRLEALHGKCRYACWKNVKILRLAILVHRPKFLGPFGGKTKFHPRYSYVALEAVRPSPGKSCEIEWVQWQ
jgi:tRNA1(Val) A37 N6-methylase TrmN6